ncbi:MAG: hypothetical protein ACO3I4_06740 [Candidatus Kapaibacteriota bacterium]
MAVLGHTAYVEVASPNLDNLLQDLSMLEFTLQSDLLTDGQLLLMCQSGSEQVLGITYVTDRPTREVPMLPALHLQVSSGAADEAIQRSGERNALLGYLDAIVIPSANPVADRRTLEEVGFFVLEEFTGEHAQSDVTDGLVTLSLAAHARRPYLQYRQELSLDILEEFQALDGIACDVRLGGEQLRDGVSHVRLTLRGGLTIVVIHDANYE